MQITIQTIRNIDSNKLTAQSEAIEIGQLTTENIEAALREYFDVPEREAFTDFTGRLFTDTDADRVYRVPSPTGRVRHALVRYV